MTGIDAVILAGGRGSRLGGRDKPALVIAGRSLLDRVVEGAITAGARRIIVAGPSQLPRPDVLVVREDPPFGGPVAGLAAALPLVRAEEVLVLAADLVHGDAVVARLASAAMGPDGVCLVDSSGTKQWLAMRLRTEALRTLLERLPTPRDAALRQALAPLALAEVPVPDELVRDIDTPDDLEEAWRTTKH